jgi:hypothetical protein
MVPVVGDKRGRDAYPPFLKEAVVFSFDRHHAN